MNRELRTLAAGQGGAFTLRQASAAGITVDRMRGLVRRGQVTRLRRGVFAETSLLGELASRHAAHAGAALLRITRPVVVSHASALVLHGVAVRQAPAAVSVTTPAGRSTAYDGLVVHAAGVPLAHVHPRPVRGLTVTTVARAVVDLARTAPLLDGVIAADAALHSGRLSARDVQTVLTDCANWPGALAAYRVLDLADGRAESPLESASRVFFVECGIEMPESQVTFEVPGFGRVRVDFYWRSRRVFGEADGKGKYLAPDGSVDFAVFWKEKRRQEALEGLGLVGVRWDWRDVVVSRAATRARILAAFDRADGADRAVGRRASGSA